MNFNDTPCDLKFLIFQVNRKDGSGAMGPCAL